MPNAYKQVFSDIVSEFWYHASFKNDHFSAWAKKNIPRQTERKGPTKPPNWHIGLRAYTVSLAVHFLRGEPGGIRTPQG